MSHSRARTAGLLMLLVVAILAAMAPAVAAAGPLSNVTMAQIKARGANGLHALALAQAGQQVSNVDAVSISGHVSRPGTWSADADVQAIGFSYDATQAAYVPAAFSEVATDGTYSLDVSSGSWKVGFTDSQRVYADTYFTGNVSTLASATVVSVGTTAVAGVDATMNANPVYIVSGHVAFSGATNAQPVGVGIYQIDTVSTSPTFGQLIQIYSEKTTADGDYRIHLLGGGTTAVGFTDFNDVFAPVFYANGATVSQATTFSPAVNAPVTGVDVTMTVQPSNRIAGTDPFGTAIALSQSQFDAGFGGTVVLAAAGSPDSISGGPYAAAESGPMLLTGKTDLPIEVKDEISRLNPMQVVILGGPGAVSLDQEIELREAGVPVVRRLQGPDRYGTAVQIAQELVNAQLVSGSGSIAIANGDRFADAVAGGPVAAANGMPILLTKTAVIPSSVEAYISRNNSTATLIFGGSGVVSEAVADSLPSATRLGGADRYATSALIAAYGIDTLGMQPRIVGLGCGENSRLMNSLAAAPVLASRNQVLVLTPAATLSGYTGDFLSERAGTIARITAIGDEANVSAETFAAAESAAGIQQ